MSLTVHPSDHPNLPARKAGKMPTHKQMIVAKTCRDEGRLNGANLPEAFCIANGVGRCAKRDKEAAR